MMKEVTSELATFGAGCFWGIEETYLRTKGVLSTAVGYMGGTMESPSSEDVYHGHTGHAEVVQVTYDPAVVTYEELLKIFWEHHNPTTRNRQGPDIGEQYRSAIFTHAPEQKEIAEQSKRALEEAKTFDRPIVTQIVPASDFWKAEDYHQQYLRKRGLDSCHI
jgi:peptide-methionine (S)-S-oxide reductase